MAEIAEAYIRLRPYYVAEDRLQRLGRLAALNWCAKILRIFFKLARSRCAFSEIVPMRRARSIFAEKLPRGPLVRKSRSAIV